METGLLLPFTSFSARSCPQLHHICMLFLFILDLIICDELVSQWSPAKCSSWQEMGSWFHQVYGPNCLKGNSLLAFSSLCGFEVFSCEFEMQIGYLWRQTELCLLLRLFQGEKCGWTVFIFWAWTCVVEQWEPLVIGTISLWEHNECSNNKIGINKKGFVLRMLSGKGSSDPSGQGTNRHIPN